MTDAEFADLVVRLGPEQAEREAARERAHFYELLARNVVPCGAD